MIPSKSKIQIWNKLVEEVFNHPKSEYSFFVYEMCRRRVLGTTKKEFREVGHDFGIKDIEGYFDWDDNRLNFNPVVGKIKTAIIGGGININNGFGNNPR